MRSATHVLTILVGCRQSCIELLIFFLFFQTRWPPYLHRIETQHESASRRWYSFLQVADSSKNSVGVGETNV